MSYSHWLLLIRLFKAFQVDDETLARALQESLNSGNSASVQEDQDRKIAEDLQREEYELDIFLSLSSVPQFNILHLCICFFHCAGVIIDFLMRAQSEAMVKKFIFVRVIV